MVAIQFPAADTRLTPLFQPAKRLTMPLIRTSAAVVTPRVQVCRAADRTRSLHKKKFPAEPGRSGRKMVNPKAKRTNIGRAPKPSYAAETDRSFSLVGLAENPNIDHRQLDV